MPTTRKWATRRCAHYKRKRFLNERPIGGRAGATTSAERERLIKIIRRQHDERNMNATRRESRRSIGHPKTSTTNNNTTSIYFRKISFFAQTTHHHHHHNNVLRKQLRFQSCCSNEVFLRHSASPCRTKIRITFCMR